MKKSGILGDFSGGLFAPKTRADLTAFLTVGITTEPSALFQSVSKPGLKGWIHSATRSLVPLAVLGFAMLTACGPTSTSVGVKRVSTVKGSRTLARNNTIVVTDLSGAPIANARILIGSRQDAPFPGNFIQTGSDGQVAAPTAWITPEPVTIEAPGYLRTTFFSRLPQQVIFQIKPAPSDLKIELRGETTGYSNLSMDGYLDLSLVMPGFSRAQFPTLEPGILISQEQDQISVLGKTVKLPSNLAIPRQTETYYIPITIAKPSFRIFYPSIGSTHVSAVHVRFNVDDVADQLQNGKPATEVINHLQFIEGTSQQVRLQPNNNLTSLAINSTPFAPLIPVQAPNFDANLMMMSMAIPELNGTYTISDAKRLLPGGHQNLTAPRNGLNNGFVIAFLKSPPRGSSDLIGAAAETSTAMFYPAAAPTQIRFLPIVKSPRYQTNSLILDPPQKMTEIAPAMTYAVLMKVELLNQGKYKLEKKTPEWELYASDWATNLDLPLWPGDIQQPVNNHRWLTLFAGQEVRAPKVAPGPLMLEKVTHVTRSAVDF